MYSFISTKTVCGPNMLFYQITFEKKSRNFQKYCCFIQIVCSLSRVNWICWMYWMWHSGARGLSSLSSRLHQQIPNQHFGKKKKKTPKIARRLILIRLTPHCERLRCTFQKLTIISKRTGRFLLTNFWCKN